MFTNINPHSLQHRFSTFVPVEQYISNGTGLIEISLHTKLYKASLNGRLNHLSSLSPWLSVLFFATSAYFRPAGKLYTLTGLSIYLQGPRPRILETVERSFLQQLNMVHFWI